MSHAWLVFRVVVRSWDIAPPIQEIGHVGGNNLPKVWDLPSEGHSNRARNPVKVESPPNEQEIAIAFLVAGDVEFPPVDMPNAGLGDVEWVLLVGS